MFSDVESNSDEEPALQGRQGQMAPVLLPASRPATASRFAVARMVGTDRRQLLRKDISLAVDWQHGQFLRMQQLLQRVLSLKKAGKVNALAFVLERMYDETPALAATGSLDSAGEVVYVQELSKIMASEVRFGMTLQSASSESDPEYHFVHGGLRTRLVPMAKQSGPVVREAILKTMTLPPEIDALVSITFDRSFLLRHADLHPSALAAERSLANQDRPGAMLRCGLHRIRTVEEHMLEVDARTEAFLLNASLTLRQKTDAARTLEKNVFSGAWSMLRSMQGTLQQM